MADALTGDQEEILLHGNSHAVIDPKLHLDDLSA